MASSYSLNGIWKLCGFDGVHGNPEQFIAENSNERSFIDAVVPGEVHLDLERAGRLQDCNFDQNAKSARWVEEEVWVYRTRFAPPHEAVSQHAWLVFDGLDLDAVIYLNGEEIGRHDNAYVPCRVDVTGKLRNGVNTLAVVISSGVYSSLDKPGKEYCRNLQYLLTKRIWNRKPQYSYSWDWNPRLINAGIWRPVRLEWTDTARIDAVTVYPELAEDHASAVIHGRVFTESVLAEPTNAIIRMHVTSDADDASTLVAEREVELQSGASCHEISVEVESPRLWWPRLHGDQPLYNVRFELEIDGKVADSAERRTGIRSIRICTDPHPDGGEYFALEVNGRWIFSKGANWVPPDMIYARPDAERYRKLVELACGANFNTLRIWGGGLYADKALMDACDEMGVLVWHDFIFACAKYPGDDPEFLNNVRREIAFNVRELSPHPSLVVWCGNNEIEWGDWDWDFDQDKAYPDYALYHHEIPRIILREDPSRPYWPSSPYSTGNRHPNDPTTGDQHPWYFDRGENGCDIQMYRSEVCRFSDEGGVLGVSSPATLKQFMPEDQRRLFSPCWEFHDNSVNYVLGFPFAERIVENSLGRKSDELGFDDYCFYSAIIQSEGLQEYINNFRRRMFSSAAAVFWMYNDSWPVAHGWSIVDYYLRRKLAYHPVRRAFAPVSVIPAIEGEKVLILAVNDTPNAWTGSARCGLFSTAGGLPMDDKALVTLKPNGSTLLTEIPLSTWKSLGENSTGAFAMLLQDGHPVAQNRIFTLPFKDIEWAEPQIKVERMGGKAVFSSSTFVWAVCLDVDGESAISDDVFDLIPGIEYEIDYPVDKPLPKIQRTGSPLRR